MCNVCRRFVDHFAKIAAPVTAMLRKGEPDVLPDLDEGQTTAFNKLKECLISPPVLKLPRLGRPYSLDTDASDAQLACTLLQTHEDGHRYAVGYWSRTLSSAERNYSTTEKECLAIVWAVQTLRPNLERERFTVNTVPIDEVIPCYSVKNFDDGPQHQEETYDKTDVEISAGCYALDPPASMAAINHEEFSREQHSDPFCKEVTSRLEKGRGPPNCGDPDSS